MIFIPLLFIISNTTDSSEVVNYSGKKIVFKVDSSIVYVMEEARASYKSLTVVADTLRYNLKSRVLDAWGNVIFNDGENDIESRKMRYFVDEKRGLAFDSRTEVEKGWFYGKKTRYYEGNILKIEDGYFTTCDKKEPHYWFYSPKMRVNMDDNVVAEPVFLLVGDIPVFFVPYWFYPLKKERTSGILTPTFGSSSYGGKYIKNIGWYQTLGPHADVIISFDYYTKQGLKNRLNGRWMLSPYGKGELNGSYIRERETGNERWELNASNSSKLPGNVRLNLYSDIASDNEYQPNYEPGEVQWLLQDIAYGANLSGHVAGFGLYGNIRYKEDLVNDNITKRWPAVNVSFPRFRWKDINFSGSSSFLRDESNHWASGIDERMNTGFNFLFLNLNFNYNFTGDYYQREGIFVPHWSSRVSAKTRIYGTSLLGIGPVSKFRHVITPSVSFSYAPDVDSVEVTPVPGFSIPGGRKSFGVSLGNLFQCKINKKKYDFASLNFGTSYKPQDDRFTPVSISGNFWLGKNLKTRFSTNYDFYSEEFGDKIIDTDLRIRTVFEENPLNVTLTHRIKFTEDESIQQADGNLIFNATENWKVNMNMHYDFEENKITSSSLRLIRDLHCWQLSVSINRFGSIWDYNFKLDLKKIPEIKLERGTFRTLFP